jgi:hypothetical protein
MHNKYSTGERQLKIKKMGLEKRERKKRRMVDMERKWKLKEKWKGMSWKTRKEKDIS